MLITITDLYVTPITSQKIITRPTYSDASAHYSLSTTIDE
jgi:hypothetical protein